MRTSGMRMTFDVGGNFLQAMAKAVAATLTSHSAGGCKIEIVGYQEFDTTVSSFAATELSFLQYSLFGSFEVKAQ